MSETLAKAARGRLRSWRRVDATVRGQSGPGAPGAPDPPRDHYRRRQRRRAIIGWSVGFLAVALVGLSAFLSAEDRHSTPPPLIHIFSWEMTSLQYEEIHKGQGESLVLSRLHSTGLQEDEVQGSDVLQMFPPPPRRSRCSFWKLSDAPDHLVRLCFSERDGAVVQKSVRAPGEGGAESTLA